jgi:uncharacterized membrane protein
MSMNRRDLSRRRATIYAALGLLSLFSVALIGVRYAYSHEPLYGGLIWNLFLAWVPFGLAILIYDRHRSGSSIVTLLPLGALWLLFLPNAPYIVTDFKHLEQATVVPRWVDIVVIAAPAWTGMLLGFLSIYLVQAVVRRVAGVPASWATAVTAISLASFGVYLGRMLRWNSWDVLTDPALLLQLRPVMTDIDAIAMTTLIACFLTLSYFVVYAFTSLDALEADDSPGPRG